VVSKVAGFCLVLEGAADRGSNSRALALEHLIHTAARSGSFIRSSPRGTARRLRRFWGGCSLSEGAELLFSEDLTFGRC